MIKTYKWKIKVLSPILHNADRPDEGVVALGNETFFRKMKVNYDGEVVNIPVYSGNGLRGQMRRLGAKDFIERLGLSENDLSDKAYYLLTSGGALEEKEKLEKRKKENLVPVDEIKEKIPLVSLLGGSYINKIIPSKLEVDIAMPLVDEVAALYNIEKPGIRAREVLGFTFYTRRDEREERSEEEGSQQMIYKMEYLASGIVLLHGFTLYNTSKLEESLFARLVNLLIEYGRIGGKVNQGHGKVEFKYDLDASDEFYLNWIEENGEIIKEVLKRI